MITVHTTSSSLSSPCNARNFVCLYRITTVNTLAVIPYVATLVIEEQFMFTFFTLRNTTRRDGAAKDMTNKIALYNKRTDGVTNKRDCCYNKHVKLLHNPHYGMTEFGN